MNMFKHAEIRKIVAKALGEDIGKSDITTNALIPKDKKIKAVILTRQRAVVCGIEIAKMAFRKMDKNTVITTYHNDSDTVKPNSVIMQIEGNARAILSAERTALNFLSHLSGIATRTAQFIDKLKPFKAKIFDTRKTIPGLRLLGKYAVRCGGGFNHRMDLGDMVLIKDNHKRIIISKSQIPNIKHIIEYVREKIPKTIKIEIEVENLKEFKDVFSAKPDIIMLDNMNLADIKKAVNLARLNKITSRPKIEASGNVTLNNVRAIARTGVDMISIGSLTHSVKAIDMALEVK